MDKVEEALAAEQINENDYINTLDTLMVMNQVIIPFHETTLKFMKQAQHRGWTMEEQNLWVRYQKAFKE